MVADPEKCRRQVARALHATESRSTPTGTDALLDIIDELRLYHERCGLPFRARDWIGAVLDHCLPAREQRGET